MRMYNTEQLQETASEFCEKLCGFRDTDFCLITEGSVGITCPVQNYVDYLEQSKNLRY